MVNVKAHSVVRILFPTGNCFPVTVDEARWCLVSQRRRWFIDNGFLSQLILRLSSGSSCKERQEIRLQVVIWIERVNEQIFSFLCAIKLPKN